MSDSHGRFIWYELMTPDTAGAKTFYSTVVGWTCNDMAMPGMTYTVVGPGVGMGGIMEMTPEAKSMGAPPNWTGYVAVDDADAAADKAKALGGSVVVPPQDIPTIGRFAVITDPHGAVIAIMTPAPTDDPRPRAERGTPGHTSWRELYAGDLEADFAFYVAMFGWKKDSDMDMGPMGAYRLFSNQDGAMGGMMRKPENVPAPAWLYYFQVGDIDEAAGRVTGAGGRILMGPMEVPNGEWVVQGQDPQGAMFALVGKKAG
jgi:predicted enzyme related to lactoylglutathione lyase